jgi:hypothetical protein
MVQLRPAAPTSLSIGAAQLDGLQSPKERARLKMATKMATKKPKIEHDGVDRMPYDAEKSDRYVLIRDGEEVFRGTHADCYTALLKKQSRSSAYALRFGGWECKHVSQLAPDSSR